MSYDIFRNFGGFGLHSHFRLNRLSAEKILRAKQSDFFKQAAVADEHGLLDDCSVDIQNLSLSPGSKEDEVVSLWPSSLKLSLVGCKESKNATSSNELLHLEGPKVNSSNRLSQLIIEGLNSKSCQLAVVYNDLIYTLHKNNLVEDQN